MIRILTQEEFTEAMRKCYDEATTGWRDYEIAHKKADAVICDLLTALGYGDGVELFEQMPKWYA